MVKRERKPLVCVLGEGILGEKISKSLRGKCRVEKEIPQNKKTDYIFYLAKGETQKTRELLDLAVLDGAKFLYLAPQTQVGGAVELVFEYVKRFNLDARVVKASPIVFKNSANQNEIAYFDDCLEKILEAMFGGQTRGGLFLLKEPPFADFGGETQKEEKEKTTNPPQKKSFKKFILFFTLLLILPPFLTIFFAGLGVSQLLLFQKSFLKGEFNRAVIFTKIATPSFAISQKTLDLFTLELALIKKQQEAQDLKILLEAAKEIARGGSHLANGVGLLKGSLGIFSTNKSILEEPSFSEAKLEFTWAQEKFINTQLSLSRGSLNNLPIFSQKLKKLEKDVHKYRNLLDKATLFLDTAPQILGVNGRKNYLVLLQNNMELRPTGGFIGSYGLLSFEKGKFLGFELFDVYSADGQLKGHVEPPMPIKKYLGEPHWFLRDSNWDPDFVNSAAQASWFLDKEIGQKVDGVMAMDVSLVALILAAIGGVNLPDYQETITKDNLFERAHFYAQENFFPGSRQKADFLEALARAIIDKLASDKNIPWAAVFNSLVSGIEEKHLLFVFNDPGVHNLFSLNNLTGAIVLEGQEKEGILNDFLMIVEANLGVNKVNYFVKRNVSLSININESGEVAETLKITYTNQSSKEEYKNYLRIITPKGTRIKKVELDREEIREVDGEETQDRNIFGFLVKVGSRSQKTVLATYELEGLMPIAKGLDTYNLRVLKQPGTLEDPLTITVNYPTFFTLQEVISPEGRVISRPQTVSIISDLSQDREFEIKFLNK